MSKYASWPTSDAGNVVGSRLANEIEHRFGGSMRQLAFDQQAHASLAELLATTGDVLNVKSLGAVGDGVADDTAAIRDAVDAVGVYGGLVFFPGGHYRVTSKITIPADRAVMLEGQQQAYVNNPTSGEQRQGSVIVADFDGIMFEQTGTLSPARESIGVKMSRLTLYGGDNDVDLINFVGLLDSVQMDDVYLRGTTGHGIVMAAIQNSWFRQCRILQCGDATHEAMKIDGSSDGRSSLILFDDCQWELNNGIALLMTNAGRPSGAGTENILITGGKFEHRAGYPCVKIVGTELTQIRTHITTGGTDGVNGYDSTGILIDPGVGNHNNARQILIDCVFSKSVATESQNTRYFVDVVNGRDIVIRGLFYNGGADSGAHIRTPSTLSASGACRIFIDPCNVYSTPLSGVPIEGAHNGPEAVGSDRGDTGVTLIAGVDAPTQVFDTTLTQSRAITLSTSAGSGTALPWKGARFRIVRRAEGAYVLTVGTGPLAALSTGEWCDVQFDGTGWTLIAKGWLSDYGSGAEPANSGRTWTLGQRIYKTSPAAGDWIGWVVTVAGTTGTLAGVTGSITSGTAALSVNDADDLDVGQRITIVGVTGTKRIDAISGTDITLDSNADATVADAAIAWSAPSFDEWGAIDTVTATTGLTASTTQTQGQQKLTTPSNLIETVANANDVVTLPNAATGLLCEIVNAGANTLQIFPASGDSINGGSANASITLRAGQSIILRATDDTEWWQLNTVPAVLSALQITGDIELDGALNHDGSTVGLFGVAPTTQPTALTAADATAANTGDSATDDVIDNMRTRIGELETKLTALGALAT